MARRGRGKTSNDNQLDLFLNAKVEGEKDIDKLLEKLKRLEEAMSKISSKKGMSAALKEFSKLWGGEKDRINSMVKDQEAAEKKRLAIAKETDQQAFKIYENRIKKEEAIAKKVLYERKREEEKHQKEIKRLRDKAEQENRRRDESSFKTWKSVQNRQSQEEKNRIKELKDDLYNLKQEEKKIKSSGYGAIVNAFGEGFPARLATAAAYKTIGVAMGSIRDSIASMTDLQSQFASIQAITDATDASMERLRGTIFEVGETSAYSTEELAKATTILGQAGLNADQITNALDAVNKLAVATGTDLSMSVNVLTSSLAVWNKEASQAAHVSDVLVEAANRTKADVGTMANAIQYAGAAAADLGVSFEEFTAVASAVTNAGLKARSVVGTGFRSVLTELISPTAKLKKVFEQLGLTLDDVDVKARGISSVLRTMKQAGLDAEMAFKGFDRRAASFYLAATAQIDEIDKLRQSFLDEGAAAKAAERQMDTFSAQWTALTNTLKEAVSNAFRPLLWALTEIVKVIRWIVGSPLGQFLTKIISLSIAVSTVKTAVIGLVSAFKNLKYIKDLVIVATNALRLALGKEVIQINGATGATFSFVKAFKNLINAFKTGRHVAISFGLAIKSLVASTGIGLLIVLLTELWSKYTSVEDAAKEAEAQLIESKDRILSLNDAYNELIQKQKLYTTDSDALIVRGREINRQFNLQGAAILKATDSLDTYLEKLRMTIDGERELQVALLQKESESLDLGPNLGHLGNLGDPSKIRAKLRNAAYTGDYKEIARLLEEEKNAVHPDLYESEKEILYNAIKYGENMRKIVELNTYLGNKKTTGSSLQKLDTGLVSYDYSGKTQSVMNVKTFEEMTSGLLALKEEIVRDRELKIQEIEKNIDSAKNRGDTIAEGEFSQRLSSAKIFFGDALADIDIQLKDIFAKRVQRSATNYKNLADALKTGAAEGDVDELEKQLKELEARFVRDVDAQEQYELSLIENTERLRQEGIRNKIKRATDPKQVAELERQLREGTALYEESKKVAQETALSKKADLLSFANKAQMSSYVKKGTPNQSRLTYTYGLYPENPERARMLEEQFNGMGTLDQAAVLYGQKLAPEMKNFMDNSWAETALKGIETFTDGFTNAVTSFADGSKTFKEALKDFASSSLQTIGNWLIQMSIKAAIMQGLKAAFPGFFAVESATNVATTVARASGGMVYGGVAGRDSVNAKLMPGEYVLKKSAVDYLGQNFLNSLNTNTSQTMDAVSGDILTDGDSAGSVVNVWVVSDPSEAGMSPNDVIATISKDIRTGGTTRQLIKSVVAGRR